MCGKKVPSKVFFAIFLATARSHMCAVQRTTQCTERTNNICLQKTYAVPQSRSVAVTVLRPSCTSWQRFCRRRCSVWTDRVTRFVGGWPSASCSMSVATRSWSCCKVCNRVYRYGCRCSTKFEKALFQPSQMLLVRSVPSKVAGGSSTLIV